MHEFIGRYVFQNSSVPRSLAIYLINSARPVIPSSSKERASYATSRTRASSTSFSIVKIRGLGATVVVISRIFNIWRAARQDLQLSSVDQTINGPAEARAG